MKNNYIKYTLVAVLVLLQVQLYAFLTNNKSLLFSSYLTDVVGTAHINSENQSEAFYQTPELRLNFDNAVWGVNHTSVNVIANDFYLDANNQQIPLTLGVNGNATIEKVGTWDANYTLDTSTGIVTVNPSVDDKPLDALRYKVCSNGICKESSLSYQDENDVIAVTKEITAGATTKNGENVTYNISIENTSTAITTVELTERLTADTNLVTNLGVDKIEFVSWTITKQIGTDTATTTTLPSNTLVVSANETISNNNNILNGSFVLEPNTVVTVAVTVKLHAVLTSSFKSITSVETINNSDNYLVNNINVPTTFNVALQSNDLAISSRIQNPKSTQDNNTITVRVTNVSSLPVSSSSIVVEIDIDINNIISASEVIENVVAGDFNYNNPSNLNLTATRTFTLKNTVTLQPGEYREFSFSKNNLGNTGNDYATRTHKFTLTYSSDTNGLNNVSTLTHTNSPSPGTIVFNDNSNSKYVCYGNSVDVKTGTEADSYITGANLNFQYQVSNDGGLSWEFIKDAAVSVETVSSVVYANIDASYVNSSSTGSDYSQVYMRNGNKIILATSGRVDVIRFNNVKSDFLVRRYVYNTGTPEMNSTTPAIEVKIAKNEIIFPNGVNSIAVPLGQSVNLPEITTTYKSVVTYTKVGDTSTVSPTNITLPVGYHEYTVKATTVATGGNANTNISPALGCETTAIIKVIVYDPKDCDVYVKRTFATHSRGWTSGLSGVANPEQSVFDSSTGVVAINRANAATLTGGVVLLGIGTVGIDLYFTKSDGTLYSGTELQGKKVVVKFGEQYSGLKVAGGVSVVGLNIPTSTSLTNLPLAPNQSGKTFGIKGGLLDALKGDNVFEYSFTPTDRNDDYVPYNGIRIQLGSLIGVADLASVFYAYIEEEGDIVQSGAIDENINQVDYCTMLSTNVTVSPPSSLLYPTNQRDVDATWVKSEADSPIANTNIKLNTFIEDAFWGNYSEVLNVASGLSSIVFPYYAVDTDYDSYSLFNSTAGVLNRQFLKAKLKQKARPGDQVQITLAYPNINVLNLSLLQLGNFKIVYYLDGAVVGEERLEQFRVLDLGLFRFKDKRRAVLSRPVNFLFDTVELQQFNTVSVNLGDGLHVHDIRINPLRAFAGMTDPKQVTKLCVDEPLLIQKPDACTGYEISLARVTEYGPAYENADGTPMLDYNGQPIKSIYAIEDIPNSNLKDLGVDNSGFISYFDLNINKLFVGPNYEGKMLIKIQTKRQGCNYGDAQYLRVDISNCVDGGVVNPIIKSGANY